GMPPQWGAAPTGPPMDQGRHASETRGGGSGGGTGSPRRRGARAAPPPGLDRRPRRAAGHECVAQRVAVAALVPPGRNLLSFSREPRASARAALARGSRRNAWLQERETDHAHVSPQSDRAEVAAFLGGTQDLP